MQDSSAPEITVGITAHNAGTCIGECLDDCLAQTFKKIRIIVSDDASSDDTAEICRQYAMRHGNIKVIEQKRNIGAFANARAVLDAADTEYFIQRDDDDITEPEYLETLLQLLRQNPDKSGAISACKRYKRQDDIRYYRAPAISDDRIANMISLMYAPLPAKNGLFRTAYLRNMFIRLEKIFPHMTGGDSLCSLICALDNSIVSTSKVVYHWRDHIRPTSVQSPISSRRYRTLDQRLEAMQSIKSMSADFVAAVDQIIEDARISGKALRAAQKHKKRFIGRTPVPHSFRLYKKLMMVLFLGRYRWLA